MPDSEDGEKAAVVAAGDAGEVEQKGSVIAFENLDDGFAEYADVADFQLAGENEGEVRGALGGRLLDDQPVHA
ncbi:hypothetical protein [Streptomyces poonensis]|nr:hypothetical protein [Streptomyces poonensis]